MIEFLYPVSGFLMKIADECEDEWGRPRTGMVAGALCGVSAGFLSVSDPAAACIFIGIFAGTILSLKVDCLSHAVAALVFILIILSGGLPVISIPATLLCTLGAYIDEYGNDNPAVYRRSRILRIFFDYRFSLKMVVVLLAVLSFAGFMTGFGPLTVLLFLLFEAAYEVGGRIGH
ncbi:MAG: hypothetical protein PWP32_543 [Methanothermobacter sp.]|jgi:hypothetical protein|nr:hypothetical protein [Methanothermobacter sp.]MDK2874619.1 hypothetical protein [Methanothermobacter sp.]MDN5373778.1 hypothetical protein [Methanothermobacter sp.]